MMCALEAPQLKALARVSTPFYTARRCPMEALKSYRPLQLGQDMRKLRGGAAC